MAIGISAAGRSATHAGAGAWSAWAGTVSCFSIAGMAVFKGEKNITRGDVVSLVVALSAIPAWLLADSPLLAILIVTGIDFVGYYPTFRKSYARPHEEATYNYIVANIIHILSLFANTTYSWTTCLTPVVMLMANSALVGMIFYRRARIARA